MEEEMKTNVPEEDTETVEKTAEAADAPKETEEPVKEAEETAEKAEAVDESAGKIAELTDRLQRTMAEFENFRKRTEKEKAMMFDMGARSVIEKILPVIDNFERGLASVPEESREDGFVTGMDKVYRQMMKELEEIGVKVIESKGETFNPDRHNAVMHVEDDTVGENTIVEEFQKGYTYRDSVVRYSMVKVAN